MDMRNVISKHKIGAIGVLNAATKLVSLGLHVYQPLVDDHGVDLLVLGSTGTCTRLQVKTAHKKILKGSDVYGFTLGHVTKHNKSGITRAVRKFSDEVDFLVLCGIDDEVFFVVPANVLNNKASVNVSFSPKVQQLDWTQIQKEHLSGSTYRDLAQKYSVSPSQVFNRLNNRVGEDYGSLSSEVRSYFDRWDLILDHSEPALVSL